MWAQEEEGSRLAALQGEVVLGWARQGWRTVGWSCVACCSVAAVEQVEQLGQQAGCRGLVQVLSLGLCRGHKQLGQLGQQGLLGWCRGLAQLEQQAQLGRLGWCMAPVQVAQLGSCRARSQLGQQV